MSITQTLRKFLFELTRYRTLNDHWGLSEGVQYHLKIFFEKFLNMRSNFTRFDILTSPSFMLYIMALAMVTMMEAFITIKICKFFSNNPPISRAAFPRRLLREGRDDRAWNFKHDQRAVRALANVATNRQKYSGYPIRSIDQILPIDRDFLGHNFLVHNLGVNCLPSNDDNFSIQCELGNPAT